MPTDNHYARAAEMADAMEGELKRLNRWHNDPLPPEKFADMGAFGINTMTFEEWIQFVLLPRIRSIVAEKDSFPPNSELAAHAVREFDGDPEADRLIDLLQELDDFIGEVNGTPAREEFFKNFTQPLPESIELGTDQLPDVVYSLLEVLHQFEGADLESQLQTYDTFLAVCSPRVRPELSRLMMHAAANATHPVSRSRIEEAARSILDGGRAAEGKVES